VGKRGHDSSNSLYISIDPLDFRTSKAWVVFRFIAEPLSV
jgi:hypothetical protein